MFELRIWCSGISCGHERKGETVLLGNLFIVCCLLWLNETYNARANVYAGCMCARHITRHTYSVSDQSFPSCRIIDVSDQIKSFSVFYVTLSIH